MVIVILLVIAAVVASIIWFSLDTGDDSGLAPTPTDPADAVVDPAVDAGDDEPTVAAADGPAEIAEVIAWDPDGSSGENDELAPLALAGASPAGGWPTLCYSSQYLGAKRGVGLVVSLTAPSAGRLSVESFNAPYWVELYASSADDPPDDPDAWGPSLTGTEHSESPGEIVASIPDGSRYALVWLRELGPDDACSSTNPYRGRLGNLTFSP